MRRHHDLDRDGSLRANSARAVVATMCVLGLATLVWMHVGESTGFGEMPTIGAVPATAKSSAYLHAPTSDPSLPSLEATFSGMNVAPADEAPAPTF